MLDQRRTEEVFYPAVNTHQSLKEAYLASQKKRQMIEYLNNDSIFRTWVCTMFWKELPVAFIKSIF